MRGEGAARKRRLKEEEEDKSDDQKRKVEHSLKKGSRNLSFLYIGKFLPLKSTNPVGLAVWIADAQPGGPVSNLGLGDF